MSLAPARIDSQPRVRNAIAQAATRTGVDFDYLYNQARIESSLNPQARARTSSAAGLYQFTRQTWLQTVKSHGGAHGLGWAADAIVPARRGLTVADPAIRAAIDDLRFDPDVASAMAAEFAADNGATLEGSLGRSADPVDLYLAHFLGAQGAVGFLTAHDADPSSAAAPLFPAAAAANRTIFYTAEGAPRSLGDIRDRFAAKLDGAAPPATPINSPALQRWAHVRRDVAASGERAPLRLAAIEPMPGRLSLDHAARAYARLAALPA